MAEEGFMKMNTPEEIRKTVEDFNGGRFGQIDR
jgi:redox-sensitive bicupin YhaK (pirin superfamily)